MKNTNDRADFEAWANGRCELHLVNPAGRYSSAITQFAWEAYQAGRSALQSQDREDAERYRWIFTADMDEQTMTFATLNAGVALRNRVKKYADEAIDHARRVEGDGE